MYQNLEDFYKKKFIKSKCGKMDFFKRIAKDLGVSVISVERWFLGYSKPGEIRYKEYLSKLTGVPVENI